MNINNFHRFQIFFFRQCSNLFSQIWLKKRHTSLFSGICREIRTQFHQKFAEKMQIWREKWKKNQKFNIQSRKNVGDFWLKFWVWRTVKRSALCRSRRELSKEYLLAKIGVDTAENELLQVLSNIIQYYSFVSLEGTGAAGSGSAPPDLHAARWAFSAGPGETVRTELTRLCEHHVQACNKGFRENAKINMDKNIHKMSEYQIFHYFSANIEETQYMRKIKNVSTMRKYNIYVPY